MNMSFCKNPGIGPVTNTDISISTGTALVHTILKIIRKEGRSEGQG